MSKPQIIYPDDLYEIKRNGSNTYYSLFSASGNNLEIAKLFALKDKEIVLNFKEDKDIRSQLKKSKYTVDFSLRRLITKDTGPLNGDFAFQEEKGCSTIFDITIDNYPTNKSIPNKTFTFNGKFMPIMIKSEADFENYVFNFNEPNWKKPEGFWESNSLRIENDKVKNVVISNIPESLGISNIDSPSLENLKFDNCKKVNLNLHSFSSPHLKTIDLSTTKYIDLETPASPFSYLRFDFTDHPERDQYWKQSEYKEDNKQFEKYFGWDTKLILSADSTIQWDWFPKNPSNDDYHTTKAWKVKEVFDCNGKDKIELTAKDFINYYYQRQKAHALKEIASMDKIVDSINLLTKKLKSQKTEKSPKQH